MISLEHATKLYGTVIGVNDVTVELDVEGQPVRLEIANIDRARLVPQL